MPECMGAIHLEEAPGKVDGDEERIPVHDKVRNMKRKAPCEVRPKKVELAWRAWEFNKVVYAVTDIRRAPRRICRPTGC